MGYRAPQLVHNPPLREMLASAQPPFLYDSSIPDFWGENSEISPNSSDRLWPYSMDYGIPQVGHKGGCARPRRACRHSTAA